MLKKSIFALVFLMVSAVSFINAQGKYATRNGFIGFYGHTAAEDIKADNNQVSANLNTTTGQYNFAVLIKGFEFSRAMMQEHFNENYMESDKFPKATFSGKITDLSKVDFTKDGQYAVTVSGSLTIKGKTNAVSVPGTVIVKDGKILSKAKFKVKPEDYNIEIPGMVRDKIAQEMEVTVDVKMDVVK